MRVDNILVMLVFHKNENCLKITKFVDFEVISVLIYILKRL